MKQTTPAGRPRPARRAYSLVEIMIVVTLTSIVMGVVVSLLVDLQRWDQQFRERAVRSDQWTQFSERIRRDIRRAADVQLVDSSALVIASPEGWRVRYELAARGCRRSVEAAGEPSTDVEVFSVPQGSAWTLERGPQGQRPLIIVTLQPGESRGGGLLASAPLLVYGALGADTPGSIHGATGDDE